MNMLTAGASAVADPVIKSTFKFSRKAIGLGAGVAGLAGGYALHGNKTKNITIHKMAEYAFKDELNKIASVNSPYYTDGDAYAKKVKNFIEEIDSIAAQEKQDTDDFHDRFHPEISARNSSALAGALGGGGLAALAAIFARKSMPTKIGFGVLGAGVGALTGAEMSYNNSVTHNPSYRDELDKLFNKYRVGKPPTESLHEYMNEFA